jgi:hypothetical protein
MNLELVIYVFGCVLFLYILVYYYRQYTRYNTNIKKGNDFKRVITDCPDYWIMEGDKKCRNHNRLGRCLTSENGGVMDFNTDYFNNPQTGNYAKCRWTKKCNLSWEGIDDICV